MKLGDTFLGDFGNQKHLHVIISYPEKDVLVVATMISSWDEHGKDDTCVLRSSDGHPFIKHDSYVVYSQTRLIPLATLEEGIKNKRLKPMAPMPENALARIIEGADKSNLISNECFLLMDNQGLFEKQ